jgi:hypothetical protein
MTVEVTAFGTYFAEGLELVEHLPFDMLEEADLLVHLFDNQKLTGCILRANAARALVRIDENTWWLERQTRGRVHRWIVRARERAEQQMRSNDHAERI